MTPLLAPCSPPSSPRSPFLQLLFPCAFDLPEHCNTPERSGALIDCQWSRSGLLAAERSRLLEGAGRLPAAAKARLSLLFTMGRKQGTVVQPAAQEPNGTLEAEGQLLCGI